MHTGVISFCDRIAFNIKSTDVKDVILDELHSKFNIKILQRHWFRLDEANKDHIARAPHAMMLRSNGNPYYMFFTRYEDVPQIMFIDKKVQPGYEKPRIIMVRGKFDDSLFSGTLLEGEMVKDEQGQWIFLVNDLIGYKNQFLERETYPQRLGKVYHLLKHEHRPDALMDVCQFHVKKIFPAIQSSWAALLELNASLSYTNRGIYLWPYSLKYKPKLMNFDDSLIKKVVRKVKDDPAFRESLPELPQTPSHSQATQIPSSRSSSTSPPLPPPQTQAQHSSQQPGERILYLRKTENPDVYYVFAEEQAKTKMGVAHISTLAVSKHIRGMFKDLNVVSSVPFHCKWDTHFQKWSPLRTYTAE
jgi:hypothetical protein